MGFVNRLLGSLAIAIVFYMVFSVLFSQGIPFFGYRFFAFPTFILTWGFAYFGIELGTVPKPKN